MTDYLVWKGKLYRVEEGTDPDICICSLCDLEEPCDNTQYPNPSPMDHCGDEDEYLVEVKDAESNQG